MRRRPPRSTRIDTCFPYTTLLRSIHAEIDQMIEPPRDAAQIVDAVAIGILKRPGIYMVDATAFPPTLRQASLQSRVQQRSIPPLVLPPHHASDTRSLRAGPSVRTTPKGPLVTNYQTRDVYRSQPT